MEGVKKSRLRSSNITVIFSISLVLFLLGVIGLLMLNSDRFIDYMFEQLKMNVYLEEVQYKDNPDELKKAHNEFVSQLNLNDFTKHTRYISKEQASNEFERENPDTDIQELFNEDIFPASVELTLHRPYYEPSKIDSITKLLNKDPMVSEISIDNEIVLNAYNNIRTVTFWVIGFSVLFLLISIVLINNYIRLRIFSKRFIIKTMQLVGAKRSFVIKPFLKEALWLGTIGAVLAIIPLIILQYTYSYYVLNSDSVASLIQDYRLWMIIGIVILIGITITLTSTWFATWRYLRLKTDQLHYY